MFMIVAVLLIIVFIALLGWSSSIYLMSKTGLVRFRLTAERQAVIVGCFSAVAAIGVATWLLAMRSGIRALDAMRR
jgi:hypothetical protein